MKLGGRGTLKIIRECKNAGLVAPVFDYDQSGFRIKFKSLEEKSSGKGSGKVREKVRGKSLNLFVPMALLPFKNLPMLLVFLPDLLKSNWLN